MTNTNFTTALQNAVNGDTTALELIMSERLANHVDLGKEGNRLRCEAMIAGETVELVPFKGSTILVTGKFVAVCRPGDDNALLEASVTTAKRTLSSIHPELS